jgi:Flp pilus assembly protein TadB
VNLFYDHLVYAISDECVASLDSMTVPNQTSNSKQGESTKREHSLLLTACFAGLGTGFITFWLTLTLLYSGILCAFGAPLVWILVRDMKGSDFADRSLMIYLISALIGIGVGLASSFGSGLPIYFT